MLNICAKQEQGYMQSAGRGEGSLDVVPSSSDLYLNICWKNPVVYFSTVHYHSFFLHTTHHKHKVGLGSKGSAFLISKVRTAPPLSPHPGLSVVGNRFQAQPEAKREIRKGTFTEYSHDQALCTTLFPYSVIEPPNKSIHGP